MASIVDSMASISRFIAVTAPQLEPTPESSRTSTPGVPRQSPSECFAHGAEDSRALPLASQNSRGGSWREWAATAPQSQRPPAAHADVPVADDTSTDQRLPAPSPPPAGQPRTLLAVSCGNADVSESDSGSFCVYTGGSSSSDGGAHPAY